jgi:C-terminal processing protease CtpA/Prc
LKASGVGLVEPTTVQIANLALLGRVWGFLKYHHRVVTKGGLDWDGELLRVMPSVVEAPTEAAGQSVITTWATVLKTPRRLQVPAMLLDDPVLVPDLAWLSDEALLGPELAAWLPAVYDRRPTGHRQFYVHHQRGIGNPVFTNEDEYRDLKFPDAGYQLLTLFRLWNMVEYWSPYRDLVEGDWRQVLSEFIPRLSAASDPADYVRQLIVLLGRVNDTHTNLWGALGLRPPRGPGQVPVSVRFVPDADGHQRAVVDEAPHSTAHAGIGLVRGDVILSIDGVPTDDLVREWRPFYAASNEAVRRRDIARWMLRGAAGEAELGISRGGQPMSVAATRIPNEQITEAARFHDRPGDTFQLLSPEVAYLRLSSVVAKDCAGYVRAAAGTKGFVIDVRNYPGEFVPFALGGHLIRREAPFVRCTTGHCSNPGVFTMTEPICLSPVAPHYDGRVVLLVDEITQSQAEYTTMALRQAPGAVVVGGTTAGADGNVARVTLPGGLRTMITGIGILTPEGDPTQRVGIAVDVRVVPTIEGLRRGRDEVLEEGVRQILGPDTPDDVVLATVAPRASAGSS